MKNFDEKTLVHKLDKILKKEFGTNLAFHEFSAGYGIADLVFASNFSFKKNLVKHAPLTNFNYLKIFLTLNENKTYSFNEIIELFPSLNSQELRKILNTLTNNNYFQRIGKNEYVKILSEQDLSSIKKVIAIEVKLKDHKGGLVQARRYQYFADESYLAILKEAEKNIDYDQFNKYNIGLILFDSTKNTIEIISPKPKSRSYEGDINVFAKQMMISRFLSPSS